jgi:ectoine hydroxylase-related dioxygenase (phytanoyl-CoA dioxygenase family)
MSRGNTVTVEWRVIDDVRPLARATTRPHVDVAPTVIETYQRDGVVAFPGAFVDWVDPLRAGLQRNLDSPQDYAFPCESTTDEPGRFFDSYCNWQLIPEYLAFVLTSGAASIAGQLMRSTTAQLFHDHAFCKEAGTTKATPWHHDLPYYCVEGRQTVSAYVALDTIPVSTAVRFVTGSHLDDALYFPRNFAAGAEYSSHDPTMRSVPDIDTTRSADDLFCIDLEPGDALFFDFRTLHGSGNAPVADRRRAFSTRWLGDDVRYLERPGDTSPPLHGLGMRSGDRMRDDWFPILWTDPVPMTT